MKTESFVCPFCGLKAGIVTDTPGAVAHDLPMCPTFAQNSTTDYLAACNRELARRARKRPT